MCSISECSNGEREAGLPFLVTSSSGWPNEIKKARSDQARSERRGAFCYCDFWLSLEEKSTFKESSWDKSSQSQTPYLCGKPRHQITQLFREDVLAIRDSLLTVSYLAMYVPTLRSRRKRVRTITRAAPEYRLVLNALGWLLPEELGALLWSSSHGW